VALAAGEEEAPVSVGALLPETVYSITNDVIVVLRFEEELSESVHVSTKFMLSVLLRLVSVVPNDTAVPSNL
jgi:hypothetical protein